jgi:type I restriction enzyme M protein
MNSEELKKLEKDLWAAADKLRANAGLKASQYATPILGLIFLKFADNRYSLVEKEIQEEFEKHKGKRTERKIEEIALDKCGFYLPSHARFDYLLNLSEKEDFAEKIKSAMKSIEDHKEELRGVLPKDEYFEILRTSKGDSALLKSLLKIFANIPKNASGDIFGKIYEFFLGCFALAEGQGGGEFFTPTSVVKFMVEMIEPYKGTIFDPACGSGGMFVQSSQFVDRRRRELKDSDSKDFFAHGTEKTMDTVRLARMNLAVHGLNGIIRQANSYDDEEFHTVEDFDYVMANPPFNVDDVPLDKVKSQERFNRFGIPQNKTKAAKSQKSKDGKEKAPETVPNGNYLWINLFATSLKPKGKAALVMPNSASDARHSEYDIRKNIINHGLISAMATLPSNMFNTVTLPATLWFFDRSSEIDPLNEKARKNIKILFIDARNVYRQIDRAHREFTEEQVQNLATIARLYRGERHRYTELVHTYLVQAAQALAPFISLLPAAAGEFGQFAAKYEVWYDEAQKSFGKEHKEKVKAFGLPAKLEAVTKQLVSLQPAKLVAQIESYLKKHADHVKRSDPSKYATAHKQQQELREAAEAVLAALLAHQKGLEEVIRQLEALHAFSDKELKEKNDRSWKDIPAIKGLRAQLDEYSERINAQVNKDYEHTEKSFHYFVKAIQWMHERFPEAKYEDVTGLCKAASMHEIEEQDYSLNPGRYVGVVIEEDGMTEEEFRVKILQYSSELSQLNKVAHSLENEIEKNIQLFQ